MKHILMNEYELKRAKELTLKALGEQIKPLSIERQDSEIFGHFSSGKKKLERRVTHISIWDMYSLGFRLVDTSDFGKEELWVEV